MTHPLAMLDNFLNGLDPRYSQERQWLFRGLPGSASKAGRRLLRSVMLSQCGSQQFER